MPAKPWPERADRMAGAFADGWLASPLGAQARSEGWFHHLRSWVRDVAFVQASVIVRAENSGCAITEFHGSAAVDRANQIADLHREGRITISLPTDLVEVFRARVEGQRAIAEARSRVKSGDEAAPRLVAAPIAMPPEMILDEGLPELMDEADGYGEAA